MSHGNLFARVTGFVLGTSNINTAGTGGQVAAGVDTNQDGGPDSLSLPEENTAANIIDSGLVVANGHYLIAYAFADALDYPASPSSFDIKRVPSPSLSLVPPASPSDSIRINYSNATPDEIPGSNGQIYIVGKDQFQLSIDVNDGVLTNYTISWIEGQIPDVSALPFIDADGSGLDVESNEDLLIRGITQLDFSLQVIHTYKDSVSIPAATPSTIAFIPNTTDAVDDDFSAVAIYAGSPSGSELDVLANDIDTDNLQVISVDGQPILGDGIINAITTADGIAVWRNVSGTLQVSAPIEQLPGIYSFDYTIEDDGVPAAQDTANVGIEVIAAEAFIASAIHTGSAFRIDHTGSVGPYVQLAIDTDGDSTYDIFSAVVPSSSPWVEATAPLLAGSVAKLSVFGDAGGTILLAETVKAYPENTVIINDGGANDPVSWTFSDESDPETYDPGYLPGSDEYVLNMHVVGGAYAATYNLYIDPGFAAIDVAILPAALQAIFSNVGDTITASSLIDILQAEITEIRMQVNIIHHYADGSTVDIETNDSYFPDPEKLYSDAGVSIFDIVEGVASGSLTEMKLSWDNFGIYPFNGASMFAAAPKVDILERPSNGDPDILLVSNFPFSISSDPGNGTVTLSKASPTIFHTASAGNELIYRVRELSLAKSVGGPYVVTTALDFRVNQYIVLQTKLQGLIDNKIRMARGSQSFYLIDHPATNVYADINLYKGDETGTLLYNSPSTLPPDTVYPTPYNNICRGDMELAFRSLRAWRHGFKENLQMDGVSLQFNQRVGNAFQVNVQTFNLMGALNIVGNVDYYAINEDTLDVLASGFFTAADVNTPTGSVQDRTELNFSFTAPIGAKVKVGITCVRSDYAGAESVHMGEEIQLVVF